MTKTVVVESDKSTPINATGAQALKEDARIETILQQLSGQIEALRAEKRTLNWAERATKAVGDSWYGRNVSSPIELADKVAAPLRVVGYGLVIGFIYKTSKALIFGDTEEIVHTVVETVEHAQDML